MSRPFTDIVKAKSDKPIKNGTVIVTARQTGNYNENNNSVSNQPSIETISSKYGYRFYNGIFVELTGNQAVVGV